MGIVWTAVGWGKALLGEMRVLTRCFIRWYSSLVCRGCPFHMQRQRETAVSSREGNACISVWIRSSRLFRGCQLEEIDKLVLSWQGFRVRAKAKLQDPHSHRMSLPRKYGIMRIHL